MTSVGKWKIATYILAATTAGSLWYGRGASGDSSEAPASVRDASYDKRISSLARLRIPASVAGVDEDQLLRDLRSASSLQELTLICQRLGIFGTDRALDDLEALSRTRMDATGVALLAMGGIGSDEATERLIAVAETGRSGAVYWAVRGLANTNSKRAHAQLHEWAEGSRRSLQLAAIEGLGEVRSDESLEVLTALSTNADIEVKRRVLKAAGVMATSGAVSLAMDMAEQGNRQLRMTALRSMPRTLSASQQEWLMNVLTSNDAGCAALAAEALGRAGAQDALPLLMDAAAAGQPDLRRGAIRGLSELGGDEVRKALGALFVQARGTDAYELGRALLDMGGEESRKAFLAALKKGHPARADLISLLHDFSGDDVHALRVEIMKSGTLRERQGVMNQLVGSDDPEVATLMLSIARTGANNECYAALNYLAQSSSTEARQALLEIAGGRGQASLEALRMLADNRASEPEVQTLLLDALHSGVPNKIQTASWALANGGGEHAREALLGAIESENPMLANAAMSAIGQMGQGPEVMEVFRKLATESDNPQLRSSALYQLASSQDVESTSLVVKAIESGDATAGNMVSMIIQRGGDEAKKAIDASLASDSPQIRAALANALAHQGGVEAAPVLDTLLEDSDSSVRTAAVYALGSMGSKEAGNRLVELARDDDDAVKRTAISALADSGDPRATGIIAEALSSTDASLAQTAIHSAQNAGPEVDAALLALARNTNAEKYLRQQAANTLINRGGGLDDKELMKEQIGRAHV